MTISLLSDNLVIARTNNFMQITQGGVGESKEDISILSYIIYIRRLNWTLQEDQSDHR